MVHADCDLAEWPAYKSLRSDSSIRVSMSNAVRANQDVKYDFTADLTGIGDR